MCKNKFCKNEFLYVSHHKYEWKDLEFNALEKKLALCKFNSLIDINLQKIFDLWEHDFNINRSAHICDNLDFHYVYNGKYILFLLKIENCCISMSLRQNPGKPHFLGEP